MENNGAAGVVAEPARAASTVGYAIENYVKLLRALLPRAQSVNIYDQQGEMLWATRMSMSHEISGVVGRSMRECTANPELSGRLELLRGGPIFIFWLRSDDVTTGGTPLATVAIRFPERDRHEACSFGVVEELVRPVLDCLRDSMLAGARDTLLRRSLDQRADEVRLLRTLYGVDSEADDGPSLKSVLRSLVGPMRLALAALIVPEKGLALMHSDNATALDSGMLRKTHRHLLSIVSHERTPVVMNRMRMPGDDQRTYHVLACATGGVGGSAPGVLALIRTESDPEFLPSDDQIVQWLGRRVDTIIAYEYDALTGLLTGPALERHGCAALGSSKKGTVWSGLYIDVDHMRLINDAHGMRTGDRMLKRLGETIRRSLPSGALAARTDADRFSILLPASLDEAGRFADTLRSATQRLSCELESGKVSFSICVGLAPVPRQSKTMAHALALAATAVRTAKQRGSNEVETYQEADESIVRRMSELRLIANLRTAIENNSLQLSAQAVVALSRQTGETHFELLVRVINEKGKKIGPDQFMATALRYELMSAIDLWVIRRALEILKANSEPGSLASAGLSINVSGQSLRDARFATQARQLIIDSKLDPGLLSFELAEDAVVSNLAPAESFMRTMHKIGCKLALDDFGSGSSSLAYLRSLPLSTLKIDGSFIRDLLIDPRAESLIQSIAQLARSMSLRTVAKHIESDEVLARVRALGVDYGQGFAIAAPAPVEGLLMQSGDGTSRQL